MPPAGSDDEEYTSNGERNAAEQLAAPPPGRDGAECEEGAGYRRHGETQLRDPVAVMDGDRKCEHAGSLAVSRHCCRTTRDTSEPRRSAAPR